MQTFVTCGCVLEINPKPLTRFEHYLRLLLTENCSSEETRKWKKLQHKILHDKRYAIANLSIRCEQFHLSRFPLALLFLAYQIIEFSWYFLSHARRVSGTTVNSWEKYYGERLCTRFSTVVSNFPIYTFTLMWCLFAENNLCVLLGLAEYLR